MLYGSILGLLNHIYAMDLLWKGHLLQAPPAFSSRNPDLGLDFAALNKQQSDFDLWLQGYIAELTDEESGQPLSFQFIGGGSGQMTPSEMVLHLINHGSYHRGHLEGAFYQMGIEPPTTDLSVYVNLS